MSELRIPTSENWISISGSLTYTLWTRKLDGEIIYTVRPVGTVPSDGDGGYYSPLAAIKAKGLAPFIGARDSDWRPNAPPVPHLQQ